MTEQDPQPRAISLEAQSAMSHTPTGRTRKHRGKVQREMLVREFIMNAGGEERSEYTEWW